MEVSTVLKCVRCNESLHDDYARYEGLVVNFKRFNFAIRICFLFFFSYNLRKLHRLFYLNSFSSIVYRILMRFISFVQNRFWNNSPKLESLALVLNYHRLGNLLQESKSAGVPRLTVFHSEKNREHFVLSWRITPRNVSEWVARINFYLFNMMSNCKKRYVICRNWMNRSRRLTLS